MGLLHIYCGDGKGKTTAAIGLAVRAAGSGMHVYFAQFLKGGYTSELRILKMIPEITVERCDKNYGFSNKLTPEKREEITNCHNEILLHAEELIRSGAADMLIFDEFNAAYEYNLLDRHLAEKIILSTHDSCEIVLTGRCPDKKFIEAADYVSETAAVKHPFQKGIKARKGIEY